jgi:hypothetical protein
MNIGTGFSHAAVFAIALAGQAAWAEGSHVVSIVKAPISPDGDVAGARTDFVINFAVDPDLAVAGLDLQAGQVIRVALPGGFKFANGAEFPVRNTLSAKDCAPALFKCTTAVLLHGWPQHPILPAVPKSGKSQFDLTYDAEQNAFFFSVVDLGEVFLPGPGPKQMHLLAFGFENPEDAGDYAIDVSLLDTDGTALWSEAANLTIREEIAPSINITSVFVPGDVNDGRPPNPNTIYQSADVSAPAPMPWDFLIWDGTGAPFVGIEVMQRDGAGGDLVAGGSVVGSFVIHGPDGASGQVLAGGPSVALPGTPVIGASFGDPVPAGRLTAQFTAGDAPGRYVTTFELAGGNAVSMIVDAVTK